MIRFNGIQKEIRTLCNSGNALNFSDLSVRQHNNSGEVKNLGILGLNRRSPHEQRDSAIPKVIPRGVGVGILGFCDASGRKMIEAGARRILDILDILQ